MRRLRHLFASGIIVRFAGVGWCPYEILEGSCYSGLADFKVPIDNPRRGNIKCLRRYTFIEPLTIPITVYGRGLTILVLRGPSRVSLHGAASRPADKKRLFAMTLRGPSGGPPGATAWSLKGLPRWSDTLHTLGSLRAPSGPGDFLPESAMQWPPDGFRRIGPKRSRRWSVTRPLTTPFIRVHNNVRSGANHWRSSLAYS